MFLSKTNRKIIPRWRDFKTTTSLGQLAALSSDAPDSAFPRVSELESLRAWQSNRTLWHALDLVGAAFVVGDTSDAQVVEAAKYLESQANKCPPVSRRFISRLLHSNSEPDPVDQGGVIDEQRIRSDIRAMRRRLLSEPRNAVLWADLARLYTNLGQFEKAEKALEKACFLATDNRFIIRSAARFLVHVGDAEKALTLLRTTSLNEVDPWIVGAEIGVSSYSKRDSRLIKRGRRMIESDDLPDFSKSELASALATIELNEGNNRAAKKLFRQSLASPTENSIAQAEWASTQIGQLIVPPNVGDVPRTYEANFLYAYRTGDWDAARASAEHWLEDQPFSSRPATVLSHLYESIFDRFEEAIEVVRFSLQSNPKDRGLINNEAFALISLDRLDEAGALLGRLGTAEADDAAAIALTATRGLLLFRQGFVTAGRTLYLQAIELAKKHSNYRYAGIAALYWSLEEMRARSDMRVHAVRMAESLAGNSDDPLVQRLLTRVRTVFGVTEASSREK